MKALVLKEYNNLVYKDMPTPEIRPDEVLIQVKAGVKPIGKFVIGTAQGDLHDIGKNLVSMMLKGAGFEVVDLGVDIPPDKFVEQAQSSDTQLIGISALLTTTMPACVAIATSAWRRPVAQRKTPVDGRSA